MKKVLFVCIHNSARSQMAEAFLNELGKEGYSAESAGLAPGALNPVVVEAMKDAGIDISHKKTQGVADVLKRGESFDYVITVCDEANAERCPVFPGGGERLHWGFEDPSHLTGTQADKLASIKRIRDQIRKKVGDFLCGM